jgi:hypothetical protein
MQYRNSYKRNFERWSTARESLKTYGDNGQPEAITSIETWEGQVIYLQDWLHASLDYLYENYLPE